MFIEIKSRFNNEVIFSGEYASFSEAVNAALRSSANLRGSNLRGADLRWANLSEADLRVIRDDMWSVLSVVPMEVRGLRQAIVEGRIKGSTYHGACACLVGTIGNLKGCNPYKIEGLRPDSRRPIERFFLAIQQGDTPETSQFSKLALEWIDSWPPLRFIPADEASVEEVSHAI